MKKIGFSTEVGQRIAYYRKLRGLTQTDIGKLVGVPQGLWTGYERGRRNIPISLLPSIAQILEVSVADLLGENTEVRKRPGPVSKLEQQIAQIRQLPKEKQKAISTVLEMTLAGSDI